jgi:hypothetical protein
MGGAAIGGVDPTHRGYADDMGYGAATDSTAYGRGSCRIPSNAVAVANQVTRPQSRDSPKSAKSSSLMRTTCRTSCRQFKPQDCAGLNYPARFRILWMQRTSGSPPGASLFCHALTALMHIGS